MIFILDTSVKKIDVKVGMKFGCLQILDDGTEYLQIKETCISDIKEEKMGFLQAVKEGKYVRRERYTGTCNRSFYIGKSIKHEDIHAKYDNGILHLTFPKEETKKEVEEKKFIAID